MTVSAGKVRMSAMSTTDVRPPIDIALRFSDVLFACNGPDEEIHDGEAIALHRRGCKLLKRRKRDCTCSPVIVRHPVYDW